MLDDQQLLKRYADGSEAAFGELVTRYLPLVYSAARRQTDGAAHLAEDIAQQVFSDLARKAGSLPEGTLLAGWLHRATRFAVGHFLRTERRRLAREQESCSMNNLDSGDDPDWAQVRPWLDEALDEMDPLDRDALLLRFFEERSLKEVGAALGSGEEAARKRVARALEKLRDLLGSRGVTTSVSALSLVMAAKGIESAPSQLAGAIAASALVAGGAATTGMATFHILRTIAMSKLKTAIIAGAAVAGIATVVIQHESLAKLRAENQGLLEQSQSLADAQAENQRLSNLLAQAQQPSLTKEQNAELMRLRGQVGRLRDALRKAEAASRSTPVAQEAAPAKNDPPVDRTQPFTAAFTTQVADKQTLLTGGWSTAPGMRTFMLMTPSIDPAEGVTTQIAADGSRFDMPNAKVTFETTTVNLPEAMVAQFGLDQLKADGNESSVQSVLTASDAEALINALKTLPDGVWVSHGKITTADGISASMSMVGTDDSSAVNQPTGGEYTIGLTPNLTADKTAVNLAVNLRVINPTDPATAH